MRIGLVCPYDLGRPGGVQSHLRGLAGELRRRGHAVRLLAPRAATPVADPDVLEVGRSLRIPWLGTQIDLSLASPGEIRRLLQREAFDLLHFHTVWNPLVPLQVLAQSRCARVATFHDTPAEHGFGLLASRLLMPAAARLLSRRLDALVAVSRAPASYLPRPHHVIPNGVDTAAFAPGRHDPFPQYRDGRVNLLFLGRLEPRKGLPVLLEAYARLRARHPHLRLLVAGDGPLRDRLERGSLPPDTVLIGPVSEADKPRWYATCDLFCSPAVGAESFGIVLVEAMASGRATVGAANAGYRTVLPDRLLARPGSAESLEEVLEPLLADRALRDEAARWGLAEARRYDWTRVVDALEPVYRGALDRRSRGPAEA